MWEKIKVESPVVQYFIGLSVNIIFLVILLSVNTSYRNLQVPEGEYSNNLWMGTDVLTYVEPARNFLEYGVFGNETIPDYHRTIGYPLFLSVMMFLFGSHWLVATLFVQAIVFAFVYPALSKIAAMMFPNRTSIVKPVFVFSLLSGAYFATVPVLLTDLFTAALLIIGTCFGMMCIVNRSWKYLVLQVLLIGIAGQIRPTLILFAVINVLILICMAKRHGIPFNGKVRRLITVSSVSILLICNLPSLRNYVNYRVFRPTDILESNLFNYLGKNVMTCKGELDRYNEMLDEIEQTGDPGHILKLRRRYALQIYRKYPLTTLKYYVYNAIPVMGHTHLLHVAHFFGYHWQDESPEGNAVLRKSKFVLAVLLLWYVVHLGLYVLFMSFLIRLLVSRNYLYLFSIVVFICYFMLPSFIAVGGNRHRLSIEWLLVICVFYEIQHLLEYLREQRTPTAGIEG